MIDLTDHILKKIDSSETKYKFDEQIQYAGYTFDLSGTLEFVLHTTTTPETRDLPESIKSQYVLNILDDLVMFDDFQNEVCFIYDDSELESVFEI